MQPLLFKSVQNSWPCLKLNLPRRRFAAPAAPRACNATRPVRVHRSLRSHLLYWNTTRDQSEGLFRGLTSNPKYTALSKVGPLLFKSVQNSWPCLKLNLPRRRFAAPAAPRACNATRPVRVHRSLRSHLLYWNTTRDQSEGLFRGLTSNPKYTALSKVGPLLLKNFSSIL